MQYMALIYSDQEQWAALSDDERQGMYAQYRALSQDAQEAGVMAGGNELGPTRDATTVRVRGDETLVTDGPYAEVIKRIDMPASFLMLDRVVWGVSALLGKLELTGRWRAMLLEYRIDAEPVTDLGRSEHRWRLG